MTSPSGIPDPVVTIAIPTYRRADMLRITIESVLAQEGVDFEVFVVDNASGDDTEAVVGSFRDPRIHYMCQAVNLGQIGNLNSCLALGTGKYLTILHDDDLLRPDSLRLRAQVLDANTEAAVAYSYYGCIDEFGERYVECFRWPEPTEAVETPERFVHNAMRGIVRCHQSAALMRRSSIGSVVVEKEDAAYNDFGLWLRLSQQGSFVLLPLPLTDVRIHRATLSVQSGMSNATGDVVEYSPIGIATLPLPTIRRFLGRERSPVRYRTLERVRAEYYSTKRAAAGTRSIDVPTFLADLRLGLTNQKLLLLHPTVYLHGLSALTRTLGLRS